MILYITMNGAMWPDPFLFRDFILDRGTIKLYSVQTVNAIKEVDNITI